MKHKLESRLLGEISITSDMQITSPLWQRLWTLGYQEMDKPGSGAGLDG